MPSNISQIEFRLFKKFIEDKCGIDIPEDKAYLIETRLTKFMTGSGRDSFEAFYHYIINSGDLALIEQIVDAITTNETYWFRDKTPWETLGGIYLPKLIEMLRKGYKSRIRIWSAAASTGQEAYSTAMFIDRWLNENGIKDIGMESFDIVATDISKTVLDIASRGRYDAISIMRGLDLTFRDKYFEKEGSVWKLSDKIKSAVKFRHFNLQSSFAVLGKFDIIFCRYVMIYFSDALRKEIMSKLNNTLENEGVLFLGASELYTGSEEYFKMIHAENGTYYTRRTGL